MYDEPGPEFDAAFYAMIAFAFGMTFGYLIRYFQVVC